MSNLYIGAPIKRIGDARLLRGEGHYVSDLSAEGMLVATVVRSPHAHARIRSIDVKRAAEHPGVAAVYTVADLGAAQRPLPSFGQFPKSLIDLWQPVIRPAPVTTLAAGKVRYVGEPVALIVAADRYVAEDAAELVDVDYEPLDAIGDVDAALAPNAPKLFEDWPDNVALRMTVKVGEVEEAFRRAAHTFKDRYYSHRYTGVPLEGRGMLAVPDPSAIGMTVWSSHQMPHFHRALICEALSLPEFSVRVLQPDIGGGFGQKAGLYPEDVLIPFAAKTLRRPVKWLEDKREHFQASSHSREQLFDTEVAVDEDGTLLALRYRVLLDAGAYLTFPVVLPYLGLCHFFGPYRLPALQAEIKSVLTNKVTSAPYRGAGRPEVVFVLNRVIDRIARELSLDPVEVRRRNMITPEELPYSPGLPYRDGTPMVLDSGNYPEALNRALAGIGYARFREDQEAQRHDGRYVGIGVACNVEAGGIGPVEAARVKIDPSGQVIVYLGVTDTGQGQRTSFAQICADSLGVHPDRITVVTGDTAGLPYSRGTYHSRAAVTAGNAVHGAAQKVRRKVLEIASRHFEAAIEDIELADGSARLKGVPDMAISLARCAQLAAPEAALPRGMAPGLDELHYFEAPTVVWGNAVHAAIVEVDPEVGSVRILRYVVVHDCGRVLNPTILAGQVHGGVAAGIGGSLLEHLVYDEDGQLLTASLADYMLPRASDIPPIELITMETPSPLNPLGVKGAGEGGTVAPPSALAAAVEDALAPFGVRITRTPLSPKIVLAAIRARGGEAG